ncbi:MAG: hypothetical protein EOM52_12450 [Clostridia bacterium]|nr:hypothetical protein [Clostridia bacterium]
MDDPVATMEMVAVHPDGTRTPLIVEVGKPFRMDTGVWACPVSGEPVVPNMPGIFGEDSMQALCLALSLVFDLLSNFKKKGGALLGEGDQEFLLEVYCWSRFNMDIMNYSEDE